MYESYIRCNRSTEAESACYQGKHRVYGGYSDGLDIRSVWLDGDVEVVEVTARDRGRVVHAATVVGSPSLVVAGE